MRKPLINEFDMDGKAGYAGCILIIAVYVILVILITVVGCIKDEFSAWRDKRARQTEQAKAKKKMEERIAEEKRQKAKAKAILQLRQKTKDEKVQAFALKDAPKIWSVYQTLISEIDAQDNKIKELRNALATFGRIPEQDEDFNRICSLRDEMIRSRKALRAKLEDAYIAAKKYEAAPSRKDYQELLKKALEDGILEADAASARFKEMRLNK